MTGTVYFAHISDTHFGPTASYSRHGHNPYSCARRMVDIINLMPTRPDFVVHTGDVVTEPDPRSFSLAAQVLREIGVPVYYVNGNHDTARDIRRHLMMGPLEPVGDDSERLSYAFEVKGFRFLVLDGRGPDEIDPHGILPDSQLEIVAKEVMSDGPPLIFFVHYPVLPINSIWMDNNMLLLNGNELHNLLKTAANRIRGVFHGHIHQHMQTVRDGILYASVASVFSQFSAWPGDVDVHYDPDHLPGYSFVHLTPAQTIIHQHTFPRPMPIL